MGTAPRQWRSQRPFLLNSLVMPRPVLASLYGMLLSLYLRTSVIANVLPPKKPRKWRKCLIFRQLTDRRQLHPLVHTARRRRPAYPSSFTRGWARSTPTFPQLVEAHICELFSTRLR